MNFYTKSLYRHRPAMVKILLVMKMIVLLLTAAILQVSASTYGQNVTINQRNADLAKVIRELRKQTGFDFVYSNKMLEHAKPVNLTLNNVPFEVALEQCFKNQPLTFSITDKIVTIKEKEPSFLEKVVGAFEEINVSGRVVDADGRGLPGASVTVKGKGGKAVSTGANGSFYLKGVNEDAVLVVSFIGYVPKEINAAKELGDVVLELSTSKLDEVQVIAYGTTTQRLSTGNVTTIRANVIEKQPVNNPLLALQGRVPGLFIEQATGFAGTGVKVRIQGQNSLNNGNDPFYVVDGVPYISQLPAGGNGIIGNSGASGNNGHLVVGNPFGFINPSDIESIDVLKDADATAIYGSRAANGAILITTKKGKAGNTRVNLNLQAGWGKVPNKLDLMNSQQYLEMRSEALMNDGITEPASGAYGDNDLNGNWDQTRYTDWQKELIGGTAGYQDLNASVSGGTELTSFLIGAGFHKENSVFPGNFPNKKGSTHFNINNVSTNQKFKLQFSGSYLFDYNRLPAYDFTGDAMKLAPVAPALYTPDGAINWAPDANGGSTFFINPIGNINNTFLGKTRNLMGNIILSYQILNGLDIKSSFGYNDLNSNSTNKSFPQSYMPETAQYVPRSTFFAENKSNSWTIEPQVTYRRSIRQGIIEFLLGATISQQSSKGSQIFAKGFSNDLVMDDILSAPSINADYSVSSIYKYNAIFGRINYNWQDKYIVNLTGRRDGSSRFGPENQFNNFAAMGAAWVFSNEQLIQNSFKLMSFGKLRASYGSSGSDQIGDYQFLNLYNPIPQEIAYQGISIYSPVGLTNPYLQWEETRKLQIGLDLGFFKNRILFNANYYRNRSSNQLSPYILPSTTGFFSVTRNQQFKIQNSGWEIMISTVNFQNQSFTWSSGFNLTVPKTLLVEYPNILKSSAAGTAVVGRPVGVLPVYHYLGVEPESGLYQFADKDGKATLSPQDPTDKITLIDQNPKFYGGFQNTISYKGFQLDFLFSFVKQIGKNYRYGAGSMPGMFENQTTMLLNRWQKPGDVASVQRYSTGNFEAYLASINLFNSDAIWSDASYIRLKNLSLSWQLPERAIKYVHFNNCNLFVQGQNLFTITNYKGLDPETKSSITMPTLRVITFGLKVGL